MTKLSHVFELVGPAVLRLRKFSFGFVSAFVSSLGGTIESFGMLLHKQAAMGEWFGSEDIVISRHRRGEKAFSFSTLK